jgi:hypothetical protein
MKDNRSSVVFISVKSKVPSGSGSDTGSNGDGSKADMNSIAHVMHKSQSSHFPLLFSSEM